MKSLIRLLFNTDKKTYHPILYLESPLPGDYDATNITRLKSKFHHTSGFTSKEEAITDINESLVHRVKENFAIYFDLTIETDDVIEWDGQGIPADTIIVTK